MSVQVSTHIAAVLALALVVGLISARKRLGALNTAAWLVIVGAVVLVTEHPQFAIAYTVPLGSVADDLRAQPMHLLPHARVHFFMAGIYTIVCLVLLCLIARTLLREGRRAGWYAIACALIFGGSADLIAGARWYGHGSPLFGLLGGRVLGFGWDFLYVYFLAWIAALAIAFKPIFASPAARGLSLGYEQPQRRLEEERIAGGASASEG